MKFYEIDMQAAPDIIKYINNITLLYELLSCCIPSFLYSTRYLDAPESINQEQFYAPLCLFQLYPFS